MVAFIGVFLCLLALCIVFLVLLSRRVSAAEEMISVLTARLELLAFAEKSAAPAAAAPATVAEQSEPSFEELLKRQKERTMQASAQPAPQKVPLQNIAPQKSAKVSLEQPAVEVKESLSAATIFSAVGGFTLLLAVLFAFKYYQDRIPAAARFAAALLFGAGLLAAGLRKSLEQAKVTSVTLCGAGIAVIYAAFYAGYAFYHLMPSNIAFIFMALVAMASFLISIKKDSAYIAGLSVIIAFFTPLLLRSGKDMYSFLFAYIAFVNAAAIAVALYKKWPVLVWLSLIFTFLMQLVAAVKGVAVDSCAIFVVYTGALTWVVAKFGEENPWVKNVSVAFIYSNILLAFLFLNSIVPIENIMKIFSLVFFAQILLGFLLRRDYAAYKAVFSAAAATVFLLLLYYLNERAFIDNIYLNAALFVTAAGVNLWGDFCPRKEEVKTAGLGLLVPLIIMLVMAADFYVTSSMAHFVPLAVLLGLPLLAAVAKLFPVRQDLRGLIYSVVIIGAVWAVLFDASFNVSLAYNAVAFLEILLVVCGFVYVIKAARGEIALESGSFTKFSFVLLPYLLVTAWFYMHVKPELWSTNNVFILISILAALNAGFAFWFKEGRPLIFTSFGILFASAAFYALHLSQGQLTAQEILSGSLRPYGGPELAALFVKWVCGIYGALLLLPIIFKNRFIDNKEIWAASGFGGVAAFILVYVALKANFNLYSPALIPLAFAFVFMLAEAYVFTWQRQEEGIQAFRLSVLGGALLFFLTAACAVGFKKEWLTIAFAAQGVLLLWINGRLKQDWLKYMAAGLFITVFARLVTNPAIFAYYPSGAKILNWYLYTYLFAAVAMFAGAKLYKEETSIVPSLLNAFGGILLFALINIEIADFYTVSGPLHFDIFGGFAQTVTYTLAWAVFGIFCLWGGMVKRSKMFALAGLVLITLSTVKVFFFDLWSLGALYRLFGLFGMAAILIFAGMMLEKFKTALKSFND